MVTFYNTYTVILMKCSENKIYMQRNENNDIVKCDKSKWNWKRSSNNNGNHTNGKEIKEDCSEKMII